MLLKTLKIGNLSIQVPIIQGGMGVGISLSGLASAVANEGGVGVISAAGLGVIYKNLSKNYLEASILGLKEELSKARQKTPPEHTNKAVIPKYFYVSIFLFP